ncbi:MAG: EAL domain-containing protein [Nitrospirae bacterium]|nr:EAL domain-containing protein [Nitrospirota bacterium]
MKSMKSTPPVPRLEPEVTGPIRVLLLEDDEDFRVSLALRLRKKNLTVVETAVAPEAIEQLGKVEFDVVISDIRLGEMDGIAFLRAVRRVVPRLPVIFLTGYPSVETAKDAVELRAQAYLLKPLDDLDELVEPLHRAVRQYRLQIENERLVRELKESEERYRQLFEGARDIIYLAGPDGRLKLVNRRVEDVTGFAVSELVGQPVERLLTAAEGQTELSRPNPDGLVEVVLMTRNGARFDCELSVTEVRNGSTLVGVHGILRDVTERRALEETWKRYAFIVDASRDIMALVDRGFLCVAANEAYCRAHGKPREEIVGRSLVDAWNQNGVAHTLRRHLDACFEGRSSECEIAYRFEGFGLRQLSVNCYPYTSAAGVTHAAVMMHDITERKQAEGALRESEERYALAVRGANDGLWDWDLRTEAMYFSPRWKTMLGYAEEEIGSRPDEWFRRVHPTELEHVRVALSTHLKGYTPHFESEHRIRHKDGTYRWVLSRGLAVRDGKDKAYRVCGSQTDITPRKQVEQQLVHDAFHDALTGMPNRALFLDRLSQSCKRLKRRRDYMFAVVFLDLDRFKVVNDSLGHMVGDQLLVAVARRLERCLRPGDTVARLGGDEFGILLDDIGDVKDATRVVERIQNQLAHPLRLKEQEVFTSASIGIALSAGGYERPEELLRDADTAMYRAKALGKARHEVFDKGMHEHAVAQLELETDLRRALEREELRLEYQPIVALPSGRLVGFEALARWRHPTRGSIPPAHFIPVAEETGLIVPIGRWVLREACRRMREWQSAAQARERLSISVNLSSKQFPRTNLGGEIKRILEETGLDPRCLKLEITESVIMENEESATRTLLELRDMDIDLCIDDFGTGYSSLSNLHRLPITTLKIDRSFVGRMGPTGENSEIVRAIVTLAHNLGMKVVAEGIETREQASLLARLECEYGQGYFVSKPLEQQGVEALLALGGWSA